MVENAPPQAYVPDWLGPSLPASVINENPNPNLFSSTRNKQITDLIYSHHADSILCANNPGISVISSINQHLQ